MKDHWEFYCCQMGEHRAFVTYNHGIHERIDKLPLTHVIKVKAPFKSPDVDGLPPESEFSGLAALEDAFLAFVAKHQGVGVGRLTVDGARHFYAYVDVSERELRSSLRALKATSGYDLKYSREPDPSREIYWRDLYPSPEDWQVVQDLKVIQALEEEGDDLTEARRIDHWAYFPSPEARDAFVEWLLGHDYLLADTFPEDSDSSYGTHFYHVGVPNLDGINPHSIGLMRKAQEFGGEYDGWETEVRAGGAA